MPVGFGSGVEQFQAGRQLAGENAVGTFIKSLLGQVTKWGEIKAEAQAKADIESKTQGQLPAGFIPTKITKGGVTFESPRFAAEQKLAEATATRQAEVRDAAVEGIRTISNIRGLIKLNPQTRQLGNKGAISYSLVPGAFLKQDTPDQRDLRTLQGKLHNLVALVRTGRQGLEQQIPFVAEQYNLGATDPDETIVGRLNLAENELIERAGITPEDVERMKQLGLMDEFRRRGVQF